MLQHPTTPLLLCYENGISPLRLDGYDFYFMTQLAYIANM